MEPSNWNRPIWGERWLAAGLRVPQSTPVSQVAGLLLQKLSHLIWPAKPLKEARSTLIHQKYSGFHLIKSGEDLVVFVQILLFSLRSNYDLVGFTPIWLRFGGFWTNLTKIKWFWLRFGEFCSNLAKIQGYFAQIH